MAPLGPIVTETLDAVILCDFYNTVPAAGKILLTNWCGVMSAGVYVNGPCTGTRAWKGVTCTANRVTRVMLNHAGIGGGSLPTSIGGLDALNYLDLSSNSLSGSIPSQFGGFTGLNTLYLYSNLVGPVPASLCNLLYAVTLYIQGNTGLTCYPSCLTKPPYINLQKDATLTKVCPSGK